MEAYEIVAMLAEALSYAFLALFLIALVAMLALYALAWLDERVGMDALNEAINAAIGDIAHKARTVSSALAHWLLRQLFGSRYVASTGTVSPSDADRPHQDAVSAPSVCQTDRQTKRQRDIIDITKDVEIAVILRAYRTPEALVQALRLAGWGVGQIRAAVKLDNNRVSQLVRDIDARTARTSDAVACADADDGAQPTQSTQPTVQSTQPTRAMLTELIGEVQR